MAAFTGAANEPVVFVGDDNSAIRRLRHEADNYDLEANGGRRMECYLILHEQTSLWLMQTVGLPPEIHQKVDVFATTIEDLTAKAIFVRLPCVPSAFPPLDRHPITRDSDSTVHLVIFGFSPQAEALAINATLVAHYPNYNRNAKLRTRITIVDENVYPHRNHLTQRFVHLFDNSYYRTIDLGNDNPQCTLHRPMYESSRKDFVDIEWEFVNGSIRDDAVRQKLCEWSDDPRQQLTIAVCHADQSRNAREAFAMPQAVYEAHIPVLCHNDESDLLQMARGSEAYASIYPFGSYCCNIDTLRRLKMMAQRVNYVYHHCFSLDPDDPVTAPSAIDAGRLEELWRQVGSLVKQYSNIFNAMTLGTKMHSVGHTSDDWKEYYALTLEEINTLTEVEHNRWSVEELILGYRPVNDEEQKLVEQDIAQKKVLRNRKIHYDLRAYDDLRADATGKNVNVYDMALTQGIPLIIKSCITD